MNFKKLITNPVPYVKRTIKSLKDLYRTLWFAGTDVLCELCGWKGKRFFKGECPKCNSLPRTRLIPFTMNYFKLMPLKGNVLHIAPNYNEFNYMNHIVNSNIVYDRLNIRPVKHVNLVQDLTSTNLKSNTYNLAIAWHVLEHIPQDIKAISEVYRLLKPKGQFLVSVPIYPLQSEVTFEDKTIPYKDFGKIHGHYDHCRSCGLDYFKRFESIGFITQELKVSDLLQEEVSIFGLSKGHVVWCFTK